MSTPTRTRHRLDGDLGPIDIDVRAGGRDSPRPAVLILHGFKGFKDWGMFPPFAERLARAGFTAVSFNMSGSGVDAEGAPAFPERFARNTIGADLRDTSAVARALSAGALGVVPPSRMGIVGHSRGGGVALLYAAEDPQVGAVVTWAAIATINRWDDETRRRWRERGSLDVVNGRTGQVIPVETALLDEAEQHGTGLDIRSAASRLAIPWLSIHGTDDESVPFEEGKSLAESAASPGRVDWMPLAGAGHTFGAAHPWRPPVPAAEQVFDATIRFLARVL